MVGLIHRLVDRHPLQRAIFIFGIILGSITLLRFAWRFPEVGELDFHAYYFAGEAVAAGEPFVGWAITEEAFIADKAYVYLPITAPLFFVFTLFPSWESAYLLNTTVIIASLLLLGVLTVRFIESYDVELDPIDRWLIVGFITLSFPASMRITQGNVDPIILLVLSVGLLAIESGREYLGGALWAGITAFKLFPALLGIWLLYRRAYRAIAAAVAVGVGLLVASVALYGVDTNRSFFEFILTERSRQGAFLGGLDPTHYWVTLRRPLSHLVYLDGHGLTILAVWLVIPFLALLYLAADSELDRIVVYFATVIALLVTVIPSTVGYVIYLLFPLVALLYVVEQRVARWSFAAGLLLVNVPVFPHDLEAALLALPLPEAITTPVIEAAYAVLTYGSVALWGMVLVFLGCLSMVVGPRVVAVVRSERRDPTAVAFLLSGAKEVMIRPQLVIPFAVVLVTAAVWEVYDGVLVDAMARAGFGVTDSLEVQVPVSVTDPYLLVVMAFGLLLGVFLAAVTLAAIASVVWLTADRYGGGSLSEGASRAVDALPALLVVALLAAVLIPLGLVLFVLPGLLLTVVFAVALPAIVLDDRGPVYGLLTGVDAVRRDLQTWSLVVAVGVAVLGGMSLLPFVGPALAVLVGGPVMAVVLGRVYRSRAGTDVGVGVTPTG